MAFSNRGYPKKQTRKVRKQTNKMKDIATELEHAKQRLHVSEDDHDEPTQTTEILCVGHNITKRRNGCTLYFPKRQMTLTSKD